MEKQPEEKILRINNQINDLFLVECFLDQIGEEWELPASIVMAFNLAIEEALTNIISYGYDDHQGHTIELSAFRKENEVTVCIADDGHPYDPTLREDPDVNLSAEDRPIGGLGIYLIKKMMDKVEYQRKENKNILIITKKAE